jgi:hypothetical protein
VGRLPFLLSRCNFSALQKKEGAVGGTTLPGELFAPQSLCDRVLAGIAPGSIFRTDFFRQDVDMVTARIIATSTGVARHREVLI